MERLTEKFKDGRNILRKGIADIFHVGFGRFFEGEAVDKLSEYEDLEEQGKLLMLPCAVRDRVWIIDSNGKISYCGISTIMINEHEVSFHNAAYICNLRDFGKTVFLTREEAEAALKEI